MAADSGSWWSRVLGRFGSEGGPQKLSSEVEKALAQTADPDPQVRRSAAWQLGKLGCGASEVIEKLSDLRRDPNEYVRRAATWALKIIESS